MKRTVTALLLLTLPLTACSGGSAGSAADSAAAPEASTSGGPSAQTFLLRGNDRDQFAPKRFAAQVGTLELTLQNGNVPHNVTFDDPSLTGIPTISGDERKSTTLTFAKPGTYQFVCTIHPGMDGAIVVS